MEKKRDTSVVAQAQKKDAAEAVHADSHGVLYFYVFLFRLITPLMGLLLEAWTA